MRRNLVHYYMGLLSGLYFNKPYSTLEIDESIFLLDHWQPFLLSMPAPNPNYLPIPKFKEVFKLKLKITLPK